MTDPEIAQQLNVSTRHLRELRALDHLPKAGEPLLATALAYVSYLQAQAKKRPAGSAPTSLDGERERLAREQADQVALKNAAMRGELVPVGPIQQALVGMVEVVKAKLLRLPAKLHPQGSPERARLRDAIEAALIDLSAHRAVVVDEPAGEGGSAEVGPASAANPARHR